MKLGEPTVQWPTDPSAYYIYCMYHTFFWGPYPSMEAVAAARERLDAVDSYWNYDCDAVVRGDLTPEGQRRIENLTYISKQTGQPI